MKSLLTFLTLSAASFAFAGAVVNHSGYCTAKDLQDGTCGATSLEEAKKTSEQSQGSCYVKPVFAQGHGNRPVGYVCQIIGD